MDPDACFSTILEQIVCEQWDEAAYHADSLKTWMTRGGFPPGGGRIRKTSIHSLLNWLINHPEREEL
jgi:hypothetical protein